MSETNQENKSETVESQSSEVEKKEEELKETKEKEENKVVEDLKSRINESEKIIKDIKIAYREKVKEFDDYKRRLEKDFERRLKHDSNELVKNLLPVLDALEKGIASSKNIEGDIQKNFLSLQQGLFLIYDLFVVQLKQMGVEKRDVVGNKFQPEWQEAVEVIAVEKEEDHDVVLQEFEKGYFVDNKLIRPAKVKVGRYIKKEGN